MMSLTHFFFFALHRFRAMARAATRAGNGKKGKGKSEMGKGSSGGQVMMRARMTLALFQVTTTIGVGTQ